MGLRWGTSALAACVRGTPGYALVASLAFGRSGCCTGNGSGRRSGLLVLEVIVSRVVI
jgi:hypothetical protein